ncbi:DUF5641 domain-containing protein [Trichonephila clavipes]|nr:DUF5641 domain-containing protein [Trichonephila clavipes]
MLVRLSRAPVLSGGLRRKTQHFFGTLYMAASSKTPSHQSKGPQKFKTPLQVPVFPGSSLLCDHTNSENPSDTTTFHSVLKLWVLKFEWDEPLSNPIAKEWNDFVSTLPVIQNIHVPRLVIGKGRIIIHGFADASTAVYGAVLYAHSISEEDVSTRLLYRKSRDAPVKPITIPRFELCVIVTAPGKGFTFLDATYTANNAMD